MQMEPEWWVPEEKDEPDTEYTQEDSAAAVSAGGAGPGAQIIRSMKKLIQLDPSKWKIEFFTKTVFVVIQVEIGEVKGCPGGGHGAYETFLSNLAGSGLTKRRASRFPWFSELFGISMY